MSLFNKFKYTRVNSRSESESEDYEEETMINDENQKPVQKHAVRGRAAALLANLDDSDEVDDSDKDDTDLKTKPRGIYSMKVSQTKKEKKKIDNKFNAVDKNLLIEKEKTKKGDYEALDSHSDSNAEILDDSDSNSDSCSSENIKKKRLDRDDSPIPASPPPPPSQELNKPKRKSTSAVDRQLKELELMKNKTDINRILNDSDRLVQNSDDDIINTITVRVSTKNGLHKWEINENQPFLSIFEQLAKIEKTNIENLVLILKERIINFNDTPASLNLKIYDIIDCGKSATACQERIKIIENEDDETVESPNMVMIILQTQEGRKSRMKFLISKDEHLENVLKKYCEKKNLDSNGYIMEFDGDKVGIKETPQDLDLDGGEIFDVRKSSKPTLEQVKENKKNYEFDDDILIA